MDWQIKVANSAGKNLKRFPPKDRERIKAILNEMSFNPFNGDIEKMEGASNSWRRRIGAYRIFYDVHKEIRVIDVTNIERRTSSTY